MKFKIKVKHDKGTANLFFYAENEKEAIKLFLKNEDAPESAIIKIEPVPFYVTMTDKFMSGWGMAENKTNKFIVVCTTWEQAETIQRNAVKRSEMKYINICISKPRYGKNVVESWNTFEQLGEVWKQN
jgi:hypothetical protein